MSETKPIEFEPPQASIQRIIKSVLPENIQVSKEARAAFVRAAGIFIFYLTHASNEFTRENKRQTIYPQDVINALKEIGFEDFERPLLEFLDAHRREASSAKKPKKNGANKDTDANGEEEEEEVLEEPVHEDIADEEMES